MNHERENVTKSHNLDLFFLGLKIFKAKSVQNATVMNHDRDSFVVQLFINSILL
jgi:hypothetical protein